MRRRGAQPARRCARADVALLRSQPTQRRDTLLALQATAQAQWAAEKLFEVDAPAEGTVPSRACSCGWRQG